METTFDALVYESDDSTESKTSLRRSVRLSRTSIELKVVTEPKPLTEQKPARRSGRIRKPVQTFKAEKIDVEEMIKPAKKMAENLDSNDDNIVDKILGATEINGQMHFMFKWKNCVEPTMIASEVANAKYPYHVLDFYESCLIWEDASDDEDDGIGAIEKIAEISTIN